MEERKVIRELLDSKQYTRLRQMLSELNDADIAALLEEMEEQDMLKVFRILPKDLAADVFSYMDVDNQQFIITSLSDRDAANLVDNLMAGSYGRDACECGKENPGKRQSGDKKGYQSSASLSGGFRRKHYDGGVCGSEGKPDCG